MAILNKLNYLSDTKGLIKESIRNKGVTIADNDTFRSYAEKIDSIPSSDWQPQPDWWDIDSILENDTEDYPAKAIVLISDSFDISHIPGLYSVKRKTSDGITYETTQEIAHTWDKSKDKNCSLGYATRYVIFYWDTDTPPGNINSLTLEFNELYIIIKNLKFTTGDGNAMTFSSNILECLKMINCTRLDTKIRYNGQTQHLQRIIGFNAPNVSNIESLFYGCTQLQENDMQQILNSINWKNITMANSAFRANCNLYTFPDIDTSNISSANYMFDNASNLKTIENLDLNNLNSGINTMFIAKNLISIKKISNIKVSGLNLGSSTFLNHDSLVRVLNALYDYSENVDTYTLTLGNRNLAKLTEEEKAIATDKGWTLA